MARNAMNQQLINYERMQPIGVAPRISVNAPAAPVAPAHVRALPTNTLKKEELALLEAISPNMLNAHVVIEQMRNKRLPTSPEIVRILDKLIENEERIIALRRELGMNGGTRRKSRKNRKIRKTRINLRRRA